MPHWNVTTDEEIAAIVGLQKGSDRAAAIIAATILEDKLRRKILACFRGGTLMGEGQGKGHSIVADMFRPSGPIGMFSVRIKLGYLLNLYGLRAYAELDRIKDMRNSFAHKVSVKDFANQSIMDNAKLSNDYR